MNGIDISNFQFGGLSADDRALFNGVISKYFPEDRAPLSDDTKPPERKQCRLKDDGFGIGIPETQLIKNLHYEELDTVNAQEIRKQFPILSQKVNGHDLIWFDNGATTQKPLRVIDGLSEFYKTDYSNIHRGAHTLAARSTDKYEEARQRLPTLSMPLTLRTLYLFAEPPRASTSLRILFRKNTSSPATT